MWVYVTGDGAVRDDKDEVLTLFAEVQTAWERVYVTGPNETLKHQYSLAIAVGVSRYTGADTDLYPPLILACRRGLYALVKAALQAPDAVFGPMEQRVNQAEPKSGITHLFIAGQEGKADIVSVLLDKARNVINVNQATTDYGCSPLFSACQNDHSSVVEVLLHQARDRIDFNQVTTDDGCTPLIAACEEGHSEIVEMLLGAAREEIDVRQMMTGARHCSRLVRMVVLKLSRCCCTCVENNHMSTGLTQTVAAPLYSLPVRTVTHKLYHYSCIDPRKSGHRCQPRTIDGRTPLFLACRKGHTEVVQLLLDEAWGEVNVNQAIIGHGVTPLYMACQEGHTEIVALLLDKRSEAKLMLTSWR